jgi:hypothetical protein
VGVFFLYTNHAHTLYNRSRGGVDWGGVRSRGDSEGLLHFLFYSHAHTLSNRGGLGYGVGTRVKCDGLLPCYFNHNAHFVQYTVGNGIGGGGVNVRVLLRL